MTKTLFMNLIEVLINQKAIENKEKERRHTYAHTKRETGSKLLCMCIRDYTIQSIHSIQWISQSLQSISKIINSSIDSYTFECFGFVHRNTLNDLYDWILNKRNARNQKFIIGLWEKFVHLWTWTLYFFQKYDPFSSICFVFVSCFYCYCIPIEWNIW